MSEDTQAIIETENGLITTHINRVDFSHGCIIIRKIKNYGPYVYHVVKHKGVQTWTYLGRADKLGLKARVRVDNSEVVDKEVERLARRREAYRRGE